MKSDKVFSCCFMVIGIALIIVLRSTVDLGRYNGKAAGAIIIGVLAIRAVVGKRRR